MHGRGKCPHTQTQTATVSDTGGKEVQKRDSVRERETERKDVSAGKTKTVHTGKTRQTHIGHRGENTNVCNQE